VQRLRCDDDNDDDVDEITTDDDDVLDDDIVVFVPHTFIHTQVWHDLAEFWQNKLLEKARPLDNAHEKKREQVCVSLCVSAVCPSVCLRFVSHFLTLSL
jgi:hypothetical protein